MEYKDEKMLRKTFKIARRSIEHGNHPFGALLADTDGNVMIEAENTVITESDCTGHAETNLMRLASRKFTMEELAKFTLYTSSEPCPMCAGAIFWGNVRRVVFGLGYEALKQIYGNDLDNASIQLSCREVFAHVPWKIEVVGPLLENEAKQVHGSFWETHSTQG